MDACLVAARFLHFATLLTLFGGAFYAALLAPASLAADLAPLSRRVAPALAALALASAVAWAVFTARAMAGGEIDATILREALSDTAFGAVWRARLILLVALALATLRPDRRWRAVALPAGLGVASLALVGHAAMQDGALGAAHRLNHALHLLTASAWLGGLPPFLVCLKLFVAGGRRDALAAMMRFSRFGHYVVAALFVSGALNIAMTSHAWPWPPLSLYRAGLDAKILVFSAMTSLALVNRYVLAPRIARPLAARALAGGAVAEVALGLAAVAVVSAAATLDPT